MPRRASEQLRNRQARVRLMFDDHFNLVARTLRGLGVPGPDLDDEIQHTFMVAADKVDRVRVGAERSYLFQVAHNVAWHVRRKLARRREVLDETPPERIESIATPEHLAYRKRVRESLDAVIATIREPLRCVFVMYELEEMTTSEIARVLGVPRGTVASRLRRARAQFRKHDVAVEMAADLDGKGMARIASPRLLRRERGNAFLRALLGAGMRADVAASTHAKTLALLGFS